MRLSVYCTKCNVDLAGPLETESPEILGMMLIASHATNPHHSHPLKMRIEESKPSNSVWKLRIMCTQCNVENKYNVPKEMASAATIAHHTSHEGHAIAIYLDQGDGEGEKQIHPPPSAQQ